MLRKYIAAKLLENLDFQPTSSQLDLIGELAGYVVSENNSEIMMVRGFAGTGKTTLIRALVRTLKELKQKSVLLAPTGRAAKVLNSYTGDTAFTIHKKIYRQKTGKDGLGTFVLDRNLYRNTYFIVDESSMIGNRTVDSIFGSGDLLKDVLDYVRSGKDCRLVLVGDTAQLPPVGLDVSPALNSSYLRELGYQVREIEMTDVVRQARDSGILFNATRIRELVSRSDIEYPAFRFDGYDDIEMISGSELLEAISDSYDRVTTIVSSGP